MKGWGLYESLEPGGDIGTLLVEVKEHLVNARQADLWAVLHWFEWNVWVGGHPFNLSLDPLPLTCWKPVSNGVRRNGVVRKAALVEKLLDDLVVCFPDGHVRV
ncbi:hypothetical protein BBD46_19315 [Natrialba sp. SSL1]|nr:hypothetical protein BBD46_19315 [Natrialba sp. SSL1]